MKILLLTIFIGLTISAPVDDAVAPLGIVFKINERNFIDNLI